jgi:PIN domain nuclease of toxin-antitoxin system
MRLLLDTHVLLWWLKGDEVLSPEALSAISSPASTVYVSAVSIWEASIKRSLGRLEAPSDLAEWVTKAGFIEIPIVVHHAEHAGSLPPHHLDPFDRMLIAQAVLEGLTIVTRDPAFAAYDVPLLPA